MNGKAEDDLLRVIAVQSDAIDCNLAKANEISSIADASIGSAEALLEGLGQSLPERGSQVTPAKHQSRPRLRTWDEIMVEARDALPSEPTFADILDPKDMAAAEGNVAQWKAEFSGLNHLTQYDYAVSGIAGMLAGLVDILLVKVPRHAGFLGSPAAEGGWLSNIIKEGFGQLLPEQTIRELEREYRVPYDPSTNMGLNVQVAGLGPRTHRMSSLGHDPLIGWIFGIRDILASSFTAIGSDGRLIIQPVDGRKPSDYGVDLIVNISNAFQSVAGHMLSDVATKAGLPPPLFGLLQFFQCGDIKGHSISDIARGMYRSGYDFRHFIAGSIPVLIVEFFVRIAWTVRELSEGKSLVDAISIGNRRLQSSLFLSHTVVVAMNAGKVAVTQNPLSISMAQWMAFFRYLIPQAYWILIGRENAKARFVQGKLEESWAHMDTNLATLWAEVFDDEGVATL
ncbi:MAG: hypothetical protein KGQ46_02230 [Hyphomicrobiales bacterium]|nr:hypothetical protein [Hyphomicrobiales bacterium]MDE2114765.1 hypothetical protein [Hyphomicrobiales bacterium]